MNTFTFTVASTPTAPVVPPTRPGNEPLTRKRRRRRRLLTIALLIVALMVVPGASYARALTYPGNASWQERSVEWVRDNGGAGLVNAIENWYYTREAPANSAPNPAALPTWATARGSRPAVGAASPTPNSGTAAADARAHVPTPVPALAGVAPLPGEGTWTVERTDATGAPVLYSTVLRPDPAHASVVAAAVWIPAGTTTAHLVAGTRQPGGAGWEGNAAIAPADVPSLVATFNSGWKYKDIVGGFYDNGRQSPPLVDGQASAVIDTHGQVTVGQWGRDVSMGPDVVAVRQNLDLVVDQGLPVAGLDTNAKGRWGSAKNQLQYTWRSGLGVDSAGDLIYVAGNNLTLQVLGAAMADAGMQRGMQLDIHPNMVNFAIWTPAGHAKGTAINLLPGMSAAPTRYVAADQRDFFYLTLR